MFLKFILCFQCNQIEYVCRGVNYFAMLFCQDVNVLRIDCFLFKSILSTYTSNLLRGGLIFHGPSLRND